MTARDIDMITKATFTVLNVTNDFLNHQIHKETACPQQMSPALKYLSNVEGGSAYRPTSVPT